MISWSQEQLVLERRDPPSLRVSAQMFVRTWHAVRLFLLSSMLMPHSVPTPGSKKVFIKDSERVY